ncbi:MAG: Peptidase family, partial [Solirubrobacteraceae bacterium]|nr:Peptidase family [Solirubrobacteraceae bacterium]
MRRACTLALASLCLAATLTVLLAAPAGAERSWTVPRAVSMYRFPVADGQIFYEERTDRGQDFATRPGGPVLAIGRAMVMTNRGYFPGRTVVLQLLDGPLAGRFVFYGHARRALVRPGQVVRAGQPVSIAGGVGAPGDPGHMEVGFALTENGVIPATERCDHYTHSGGEMHALMHQLNPDLVGAGAIHSPLRCPPRKKRG